MSPGFDESYWRERSQYRKFEDYESALRATMRWYVGLMRIVGRHFPDEGRHLDAGCGHGAIVHMLHERGLDAYGIDASAWVIEEAKAYAPELASHFAVADLERSIPFHGLFDLITCLEVVEHVAQPEAALAVLAERLAPGGVLILTTPNPWNRIPRNDPATSDPTHISLHPPDWWSSRIQAAGLELLRGVTYYPVPVLWRTTRSLARWIPLGRRAGPGYIAVATRAKKWAGAPRS